MDLHDHRVIKAAARDSLAAAPYNPKKLILLHTGITIAVSVIGTLLNFLIGKQIETTGGLGGLGLRSMLSTIQSAVQVLVAVLLPFWEAGYCYATMQIARDKEAGPDSLLQGFRRFGPLLRLKIRQGLIYGLAGLLCFFLGYYIFMLTPLSDPLFAIIENTHIDATMLQTDFLLDDATMMAMADAYTPMLLICFGLFLIAGLYLFYRFRLATYLALDYPEMRAIEMLRMSTYQLRGHMGALVKLDLSFLWFFVLDILAAFLAYGDYLLPLIGVQLPMSAEAAYFVFLFLSLACQCGLFIWARNRVDVAYAKFYCFTALPIRKAQNEDFQNEQS